MYMKKGKKKEKKKKSKWKNMADPLYLLNQCVKKKEKKEKKKLEDGRLPQVHGREGTGPEELMKYVCEASQGTVSI